MMAYGDGDNCVPFTPVSSFKGLGDQIEYRDCRGPTVDSVVEECGDRDPAGGSMACCARVAKRKRQGQR